MRQQLTWILALAFVVQACGAENKDEPRSKSNALHPEVSLAGSDFEIDTDANLKVDDAAPSMDWAGVNEDRQQDEPSGQSDDSFGQGSKEDTEVPAVVAGSIPPNKSDLLTFGVYLEDTGSKKLLHMYWHRVQEPSGTTNMDFEFNQSGTTSANGVTPVRTEGDLLLQYDLSKGGTNPVLYLAKWLAEGEGHTAAQCESANKLPCWGARQDLSAAGIATGSINSSAIPAADADGLGDISPRTFGEASVDFSAIVGNSACISFGSAYLKSRSSDSFTAAMKDFIKPKSVNISNCGSVKVIKLDDASPPNKLGGAAFSLIEDAAPTFGGMPGAEDTTVAGTCVTDASGECLFTNILQGEYWLVETAAPAGHDPATPAYQHVTVVADGQVSKTFVNPRQRGAIVITKVRKHAASGPGDWPHAGVEFTVNGVKKTTDASGTVCFDQLLFGTYKVTETVPTGYRGEAPKDVVVNAKADCNDTANAATVKFTNIPLSDITVSFSSQVPGGTAATIECTGLTATPVDTTPTIFDDTSETFKNLLPGTYTCTVVIDP